jgi:hypothetical protein
MNRVKFLFLSCIFIPGCVFSFGKNNISIGAQKNFFIENRGQIRDQEGKPRTDIQYMLQAPGISVFMGNGQLHYQFVRRQYCPPDKCAMGVPGDSLASIISKKLAGLADMQSGEMETYRMDVALVGADRSAHVIATGREGYYENYFLADSGAKGLQAHCYKKITYKNVYPHIDWVIYMNGEKLEHEFIVRAGGDPSVIKLKYSGQTSLQVGAGGSLAAITPLGTIKEHMPVCYVSGTEGNAGSIKGSFLLNDGDVLSYNVDGYKGVLVIDPVVEWGTYYGPDSSTSPVYASACDINANVYICGLTYSNTDIATSGSYQNAFGGYTDAYLVKFDSSGNRLWASYYGGVQGDWGTGVACDNSGNVYLTGATASVSSIATAGAQQGAFGGGLWDGFLAKFNSAGVLQWGTYYGGSGADIPYSTSCDNVGHVYIGGFTTSANNIATTGGCRPVSDGGYEVFLAQFDTSGNLQWGTYYGGPSNEFGGVCAANGFYVYLTAWTSSVTGISSAGSFQPAYGGGSSDAFVAKFDYLGNRVWATYYGGEGYEGTGGITSGASGYIYLLGSTGSDTGIASPGCFQPAYAGGGADAFLVKLEPEEGMRVWGTYYGGEQEENVGLSRIITDDSDNVFITGYTASLTGISSPGAWQAAFGGGDEDAFFAKYNSAGVQQWATYYGGNGTDEGMACAFDGQNVYLAGESNSTNNIATPGGLEPGGGSAGYYYEGFLAKFAYRDTGATALGAATAALSAPHIAVYPTPNNGSFTLTGVFIRDNGIANIKISDMNGNSIWKGESTITGGLTKKEINLGENVPAGAYLIRVSAGNDVSMCRVVKE